MTDQSGQTPQGSEWQQPPPQLPAGTWQQPVPPGPYDAPPPPYGTPQQQAYPPRAPQYGTQPPYGYPPQQPYFPPPTPPRRKHGGVILGIAIAVIAVIGVAVVFVNYAAKTIGGADSSDPACREFRNYMSSANLAAPPATYNANSTYDYLDLGAYAIGPPVLTGNRTVIDDLNALAQASSASYFDQNTFSTTVEQPTSKDYSDAATTYSDYETVANLCGLS